ncbi:MAG: hypothetical protein AAB768_03440 [Patescibacteria group bacterium]
MNITVLYNNPSTDAYEEQDTKISAELVCKTLKAKLLGISKDQANNFRLTETDFVFNMIEWSGIDFKYGVDAIGRLDELHIPYSGCHKAGYELTSNKVLMKNKFVELGIPTPKFQICNDENIQNNLQFPLIVKLAHEHCSVALSQGNVVTNEIDLKNKIKQLRTKYKMPVLVEEFIGGDEVQVAVLNKNKQAWVLPPCVVKYKQAPGYWPMLSYEEKSIDNHWEWDMTGDDWYDMTDYSEKLQKQIEELARRSFVEMDGRDYSRVDMRINSDRTRAYVLEINHNPGLDWEEGNALVSAAMKAGFKNFSELLSHIVCQSLKP